MTDARRDAFEAAVCGMWAKDEDYIRGFRKSSGYHSMLGAFVLGYDSGLDAAAELCASGEGTCRAPGRFFADQIRALKGARP